MLMAKRGCDDLTRSLNDENKRACCGREEATDCLISGDIHCDSHQCIWSTKSMQEVASKLSRTVVSLALHDGRRVLFACSGIAIESFRSVASFLTSASLARAFDDNKSKDHYDLKIEVRYGGNIYRGHLREYDWDHDIALVDVMVDIDIHGVFFADEQYLPDSKVVAIGRDISGKLMATSGVLTAYSSGSEDSEDIMLSTCRISEAWEGGPLVDLDGNFVGMNICLVMEGTFFLPAELILERLEFFRTSSLRRKFITRLRVSKAFSVGGPRCNVSNSDPEVQMVVLDEGHWDLDSLGYPKPSETMSRDGMILVNTFEETFGDVHPKGVWSELSKTVSDTICRNVVALASFDGERRVFACTGFFIEWDGPATILTSASLVRNSGDYNCINEALRIQVLLPNNRCTEGTLQHYNLHYNVAVVSVKDFRAVRPVILKYEWYDSPNLVAVGRCFKSGSLMASRGRLVDWTGQLDCKFLLHSTCKITKAGIGGPLVDFNGKFMGMNFYEKKVGTPSLLSNEILSILAFFKEKRTTSDVGNNGSPSSSPFWTMDKDKSGLPNRWPVPKPYWCYPDDLKEDTSEFAPNGRLLYGYANGVRVEYE